MGTGAKTGAATRTGIESAGTNLQGQVKEGETEGKGLGRAQGPKWTGRSESVGGTQGWRWQKRHRCSQSRAGAAGCCTKNPAQWA